MVWCPFRDPANRLATPFGQCPHVFNCKLLLASPRRCRALAFSDSCPYSHLADEQNYLPLATQPRLTTLTRKRKEYTQLVTQYFARGLGGLDQQIWHQIEIDVPRTRPGVPLWACVTAQKALERILYVWAIRHPASGYVQGINDLVCPFFQVFLGAYIGKSQSVL